MQIDDVSYEDCMARFTEIKIANKEGMAVGTLPYKVHEYLVSCILSRFCLSADTPALL